MPSFLEYIKEKGQLPPCLTMSLAAYIAFYHNAKERGEGCLIGDRNGEAYEVKDDAWVLDFYYDHRNDGPQEIARAVVRNADMWDGVLEALPAFESAVTACLERIEAMGMYESLKGCLQ